MVDYGTPVMVFGVTWRDSSLRFLGYKRGSDVTEGDITEVRAYAAIFVFKL